MEGPLQRLIGYLPGFNGYREREIRRAADKIIRDYFVRKLQSVMEKVNKIKRELVEASYLEPLEGIDRISRRLERLTDSIRFADYGYTGFFDAIKIKEEELDRVYEYDFSLTQDIDKIDSTVNLIISSLKGEWSEKLKELNDVLEELDGKFKERKNIFLGMIIGGREKRAVSSKKSEIRNPK